VGTTGDRSRDWLEVLYRIMMHNVVDTDQHFSVVVVDSGGANAGGGRGNAGRGHRNAMDWNRGPPAAGTPGDLVYG
jgi:hypothetical protein